MKELQEIQAKLKAPKGQYNAFGKYKYRSCEDIIEAVKPYLAANKCILTMSDELVLIWERYYIKATATLTNSEWITFTTTWYAREEESKKWMDGSQVTWASSSYARKYALNWLFAIDDWVDSDKTNNGSSVQNETSKTDKSDAEEEKPRFNKEQLENFTKIAWDYKNADDALKIIRTKYRIWKEKEAEVRKLYESLKTINDNN